MINLTKYDKSHHIELFAMLKITNDATYFVDIFGVENIPKEIIDYKNGIKKLDKKIIGYKNGKADVFRIQAYDTIMCGRLQTLFFQFLKIIGLIIND